MKQQRVKIFGLAIVFFSVCVAAALAGGLGVYGSYDIVVGSVGWFDGTSDFTRTKIVQLGLLFDTSVAKDRLFNYRLQLGLDLSTASYFDTSLAQTVTMDIWQINFINSFGFAIVREEALRVWFGPQLGIGLGFEPSFSNSSYYGTMSNFFEFDLFAGVVLGINVNLGDSLSLCADAGLRLHEDAMVSPSAYFGGFLIKPFVDVGLVLRFNDKY